MAVKSLKLVGDFETTTTPDDLRVWGACLVDIDTAEPVLVENSIEAFFDYLKDKNTQVYFHNLKFDGEFILSYLLRNGYKYSEEAKEKTFSCLISDTGMFYSITVIFKKLNKKYQKVIFYDSLKKLPFKVSEISKAFNIADKKLKIDYNEYRAPGHALTQEERDYIINDCVIVAKALKIQFEQGLKKMTTASDALNGYKSIITKAQFERLFPVLPVELDADIRRAYKGGFVYLNPQHKNKRGLQGITFDVNSLYPSRMYFDLLPYGYPMYFEGEYKHDDLYPLYIARIRCEFELKPNHIPTIQLKNNRAFIETEYLTSSNGEIVELTLTNVDLDLMMEHYNVYNLEYICGWKFKGARDLFKGYIDFWMHIKETTTGALRTLAKLMLNSLYGKFATNPNTRKKLPFYFDDLVEYTLDEPEQRVPVYTAMSCFITAYARNTTIRSAQSVYDRFIYADTDSLHLIGFDVPEVLDVHKTRLGAWKNEGTFSDSMFIRAKTYMETIISSDDDTSLRSYARKMTQSEWIYRESDHISYGYNKVTCAGMPDNIKENVTYDNFVPGSTFEGKLMPKRYPGGVVLIETTFTIK